MFIYYLQAEIDKEVQDLLNLKKQYKEVAGKDWVPPKAATIENESSARAKINTTEKGEVAKTKLDSLIRAQGDKVRQLKTDKAPKVSNVYLYFTFI